MSTKRLLASSILSVVLFGASLAHAVTVSFNPTSVVANVDDIITIDIVMDFTGDPTVGGGTDIFYNASVLQYQGFDFGTTTLALDSFYSLTPVVLTNDLEEH